MFDSSSKVLEPRDGSHEIQTGIVTGDLEEGQVGVETSEEEYVDQRDVILLCDAI